MFFKLDSYVTWARTGRILVQRFRSKPVIRLLIIAIMSHTFQMLRNSRALCIGVDFLSLVLCWPWNNKPSKPIALIFHLHDRSLSTFLKVDVRSEGKGNVFLIKNQDI